MPLITATVMQAQVLQVTGIQRISVPQDENTPSQVVAISPTGDYLLLSSDTRQGLVKWDLATSTATTLSQQPGAGSEVLISPDGRQIVHSELSYKDKRRLQSVNTIDLTTGKKQTLVKPSRHVEGYSMRGNAISTRVNGTTKVHPLKGKAAATEPAFSIPELHHHHLKLYLTRDGITTLLAPNGENERYIWSSLSPDGQRVLYYVSGQGAFVCNTDGTGVVALGNLTAPKWWDPTTIIGMRESDDGLRITQSAIMAVTLDGQQQVLTGDDVVATYPQPAPQAGKIAFSTPDGAVYVLTVK